MTGETSFALGVLQRAMSIEREGREFYLKAARTTQDKKGQETFGTLADDERNHYNLIKRQYDALTNEGKWAASGVAPVTIDLAKPLFPGGIAALKNAVTVKSSDWDAILFGLDIEIKSYDLYRKAALKVADASGKEMLEFLAEQEMGHFNVLMMRYDSLFGPVSWSA